jgi:hypothetical protein
MIVGQIQELSIVAVLDRGAPNKECVAIRANEDVNLGQYGLMVGISEGEGRGARPIKDRLLWFGDVVIKKDDWLFIRTGEGRAEATLGKSGTETLYTVYWGRSHTVFHAGRVVPILFRVDAVNVDDPDQPVSGPQRALPRV